tara:strand:- start:257 stop:592 length:336 start_codon:yes stop_codon:yes gene_type:complete
MNRNIGKTQAILALRPNTSFIYDEETDTVTWITDGVTTPTDAEISAKISEIQSAEPMRLLREERDRKLAETDWWASSDLTMTQAQTDYRQALRDITDNATSLDDVTWPTKP